jgi:glycosyltransferase involved in cell wall biosynthesis
VAFDLGAIPEWLAAGESGELAPGDPPTPDGFAEAIVRALEDPARYSRLCRGAWERAQRFTIEDHIQTLLHVLMAAAA